MNVMNFYDGDKKAFDNFQARATWNRHLSSSEFRIFGLNPFGQNERDGTTLSHFPIR